MGIFWKSARIGERLSPYVSLACLAMAVCSSIFALLELRLAIRQVCEQMGLLEGEGAEGSVSGLRRWQMR